MKSDRKQIRSIQARGIRSSRSSVMDAVLKANFRFSSMQKVFESVIAYGLRDVHQNKATIMTTMGFTITGRLPGLAI